jgi:hypothetical protein
VVGFVVSKRPTIPTIARPHVLPWYILWRKSARRLVVVGWMNSSNLEVANDESFYCCCCCCGLVSCKKNLAGVQELSLWFWKKASSLSGGCGRQYKFVDQPQIDATHLDKWSYKLLDDVGGLATGAKK